MKSFFTLLFLFFIAFPALVLPSYAQDNVQTSASSDTKSPTKNLKESSLAKDFAKMRDILIDGAGDKPLLRGMMLPLFQPVFIAVMFGFGLWASQLSDRLSIIWSIPAALFLGLVVASFIATFHPEWKPDLSFSDTPFIPDVTNLQVTAILSALIIGVLVASNKSITPVGDVALAGVIGLVNGFTQNAIVTDGNMDSVVFWIGFGVTGLIFSIIGIGFETFLKSMHLSVIVKFLGIATILMSFILAVEVF